MAGDSISRPASVVLGCTHFPVFTPALEALLPSGTTVVDSAATTAARVRMALGSVAGERVPELTLLATDGVQRFARVGGYFLGRRIHEVELVDL
jgi:glutamate racemase